MLRRFQSQFLVLYYVGIWLGVFTMIAAGCSGSGGTSANGTSAKPNPTVVIESPLGGSVGLAVAFRWHLDNAEAGQTYKYEVRLDKGVNACDDRIEQAFQTENQRCLNVELPATFYANQRVEFAIRAIDSRGVVRSCTHGQDALWVSASGQPSPPCN